MRQLFLTVSQQIFCQKIFKITFIRQDLGKSIIVRWTFQPMFHHCVSDNLPGPFIVSNHDAFVHDDAFRFRSRRLNRNSNDIKFGRFIRWLRCWFGGRFRGTRPGFTRRLQVSGFFGTWGRFWFRTDDITATVDRGSTPGWTWGGTPSSASV